MGKKHKNGHKPDVIRKWAKRIVKVVGVGLGTAVALTPAARAWGNASGDGAAKFTSFTGQAGYEYLGIYPDGKGINTDKIFGGVASVAGGIGIMWLFGQLAKRI